MKQQMAATPTKDIWNPGSKITVARVEIRTIAARASELRMVALRPRRMPVQ